MQICNKIIIGPGIYKQSFKIRVLMLNKLLFSISTHSLSANSRKTLKALNVLTKFKLSIMNGIVTAASYSLYTVSFSCLPLFISSVALSMSTQALNQYIQVELDRKMLRTCQRPLVLGMNKNYALGIGISLGAAGLYGLSCYNLTSAIIGGSIWAGYLFIYTRMKQQSQLNTFVGSVIGSLPVYLGWAASGRSICMAQPFALFLYMLAWQHQHFYGIRWIYYDDYNNAGFKMEKDKSHAAGQIIFQTILSTIFLSYSIRYFDVSHCYLYALPIVGGMYYWGIRPSLQFAAGKIGPKELKMASYNHFMLIFGIFLLLSLLDQTSQADRKNSLKQRKVIHGYSSEDIFDDMCI